MSLYDRLYAAYTKRYASSLSKAAVQKKCNDWWHSVKTKFGKDKDGLENAVNVQVQRLGKDFSKRASLKSAVAANRFFFCQGT